MANYRWTAALTLGLIIGGCSESAQEGTEDASAQAASDELVRTADPYAARVHGTTISRASENSPPTSTLTSNCALRATSDSRR